MLKLKVCATTIQKDSFFLSVLWIGVYACHCAHVKIRWQPVDVNSLLLWSETQGVRLSGLRAIVCSLSNLASPYNFPIFHVDFMKSIYKMFQKLLPCFSLPLNSLYVYLAMNFFFQTRRGRASALWRISAQTEGFLQHCMDLPVPQAVDDWATQGSGHCVDDWQYLVEVCGSDTSAPGIHKEDHRCLLYTSDAADE